MVRKARVPAADLKTPATLQAEAEQQFPGISELVQAYSVYQRVVQDVNDILVASQSEPTVISSNSSSPAY